MNLQRILFGIGVVLLVLLILGFIVPMNYEIKCSIWIHAPRKLVYEHCQDLKQLQAWSHHYGGQVDTIMYSGQDGTVGSSVSWIGGDWIRKGREQLDDVMPMKKIETRLNTFSPWTSVNQSILWFDKRDDSTLVQWQFLGHSPFPFNLVHKVNNHADRQRDRLDSALGRLKQISEQDYQPLLDDYKIIIDVKATTHALDHVVSSDWPSIELTITDLELIDSLNIAAPSLCYFHIVNKRLAAPQQVKLDFSRAVDIDLDSMDIGESTANSMWAILPALQNNQNIAAYRNSLRTVNPLLDSRSFAYGYLDPLDQTHRPILAFCIRGCP